MSVPAVKASAIAIISACQKTPSKLFSQREDLHAGSMTFLNSPILT